MLKKGKNKSKALLEIRQEFEALLPKLSKGWITQFIIKKHGVKALMILNDINRLNNAKKGATTLSRSDLRAIRNLVDKLPEELEE